MMVELLNWDNEIYDSFLANKVKPNKPKSCKGGNNDVRY
jgi:hypothetical protein